MLPTETGHTINLPFSDMHPAGLAQFLQQPECMARTVKSLACARVSLMYAAAQIHPSRQLLNEHPSISADGLANLAAFIHADGARAVVGVLKAHIAGTGISAYRS